MEAVALVRRLVEPTDGADLKPLYEDDECWADFRARVETAVTADCRFAWVAPGNRVERVGLEEFRDQWIEWMGAFEGYRSETEEIRELDDGRVLILVVQTGTLPGGASLPMKAAGVATIRDGKICAVEFHTNREDALAD